MFPMFLYVIYIKLIKIEFILDIFKKKSNQDRFFFSLIIRIKIS